jgi:hypothetical protein
MMASHRRFCANNMHQQKTRSDQSFRYLIRGFSLRNCKEVKCKSFPPPILTPVAGLFGDALLQHRLVVYFLVIKRNILHDESE